jgi:hypothetical protein
MFIFYLFTKDNNTQKIPHVASSRCNTEATIVKILSVILRFLHGDWSRSLHVNVADARIVLGTQILPNRSSSSLLNFFQMVQSKQCSQVRRMGHEACCRQ